MQTATDEIARRHLVAVAKDLFAHGAAGTTPVADRVVSIPASRYTDPEYFEAEKTEIFRRLPLIVAASCEIREPGSHTTLDIAGIPVLVVRGRDGVARAFLNVCTHRGAILAKGPNTSLRCHADITAGCSTTRVRWSAFRAPKSSAKSTHRIWV
jgi:hypothetical protein